MASASSLWGGITAAFIGIIFSILMLVAFGLGGEGIMIALETTNVTSSGTIFDIPSPWDEMGYTDASFFMSLLYVVSISPAIIGIIILFVSAIKTQEYDVFSDPQEQYDAGGYGGQSVPQNITADEIAFQGGYK